MNLTKLHVAGIVSITLLFAASACIIASAIVEGGSTASICGTVGFVLYFAFSMTGIVLHKLGFQRSMYYDISELASLASWIVGITSLLVVNYQEHQYVLAAFWSLMSFFPTLLLLLGCYRVFFAGPTSPVHIQDQQEPGMCCNIAGSGIWVAFASVSGALLLFVLFAFIGEETEGVSAICIILAFLVISTWIVASTRMVGNDITEPLAPEEDSANTMRHEVEMA